MATNLALDDRLILEAQKAGGHKTKRDAVTEALKEYISYRKRLKITDLFGKIDYFSGYDYKKHRKRAA
jgi:Arc/MetJ family transcription regulator